MSDGVDLGSVTTTGNTDTDVDTAESLGTKDEDWLVDLEQRVSHSFSIRICFFVILEFHSRISHMGGLLIP